MLNDAAIVIDQQKILAVGASAVRLISRSLYCDPVQLQLRIFQRNYPD